MENFFNILGYFELLPNCQFALCIFQIADH